MTVLGGRYRLVERLGAGGMAVVWRAYDEVLDRPVAIKVLAPRLTADPTFRWQLRAEAQAAGKLCHPHITNVYDYGEQNETPYVVMELIDGQAMSAVLDHDGPMPWPEAAKACAEVASALAVAHAHGVVHRDVKPSNVMLTASGAKVVDFGISALIGANDMTPEGGLLGTPAYLAPERIEGGQVSPATDVYALGLLLYRALTGHLPWQAATTTQMLRAHRYTDPGPLPPVDGLPEAVALLCRRCLAKQPENRPSSAEAASVLTSVLTPTPEPTIATAAHQPSHRMRAPVAVAAVILLAATGTLWLGGDRRIAGKPHGEAAAAAQPLPPSTTPPSAACSVTYTLKRDSGREFHADLTVTNNGRQRIENWRLTFAFPGDQRLVNSHPAGFAQTGRDVAIQPASTQPIAAGDSVTVRVTGRYPNGNPLPTAFTLDGNQCEALVSGASPATTPPATRPAPPTGNGAGASDDDNAGKSKDSKSSGKSKDSSGKGKGGDGR
jgi:serine/threonine-protein kinase